MLKKLLGRAAVAALASVAVSSAASASIIPVLSSVTPTGPNFLYTYTVTLDTDQGLLPGSKLSIFDFAGYLTGSIAVTGPAGWTVGTENVTVGMLAPIFNTDNAGITNLTLTWNGDAFHYAGGPFPSQDWTLTAISAIGVVGFDGFTALAEKNNGFETGSLTANVGFVGVPSSTAVPETATWAMMILGMGMVGVGMRMRRRQTGRVTA
jgi:hypothetical protein